MTGLPKELITGTNRPSCDHSAEPSAKRAASRRFKECMEKEQNKLLDSQPEPDSSDDDTVPLSADPGSCTPRVLSTPFCVADIAPSVAAGTEVEALFEKMASTMLIMHASDEKETTLLLNNPEFSSSPFFGTRITVKEFSTAPKVFNIEIAADQRALSLLATHKDALLAAFEGHKLPFSVHRLDTQLHGMEKDEHHSDPQHDRKEDEPS
jgi:hypothetical protein